MYVFIKNIKALSQNFWLYISFKMLMDAYSIFIIKWNMHCLSIIHTCQKLFVYFELSSLVCDSSDQGYKFWNMIFISLYSWDLMFKCDTIFSWFKKYLYNKNNKIPPNISSIAWMIYSTFFLLELLYDVWYIMFLK